MKRSKQFNALRPVHGFPQVLPLDTFNDPKNGYVFDGDDQCEFGVDVMVPLTNWEVVSNTQEYSNIKFYWTLEKFSELKEHCYVSNKNKILVGGRNWMLKLYPKGLNTTYSAWLSLFLHIADDETVKTGEETYVQCDMRILDPFGCDHLTKKINQRFGNSIPTWGWHKFVSLANLEKAYLDKQGSLEVEIQFKNRTAGSPQSASWHHGSPAPEQVLAEQLRVQVPDLPHHVPHDVVLPPQLPRHRVDEDGPYADGSVPRPAPQDRGAEPRVLRVGGLREHLPENRTAGSPQSASWHHGSPAPEQVLAEQLRVQVPDLPHHVPHDVVLPPQLPRHRVDEDGPYADGSVPRPAPQDRGAEPRVLRVGGLREHLPEGEPSFNLFGFIMCIAATAARALKSVLQGILLSSEGEKLNSMNLLLYMAPIAVVFLLSATLIMEKNVLVNAKGAVAVVVSILIFKNPVSVTGMLGYSLTVCGVILYSEAKKRSK
ncbi:hypothetical protein F2Q69_00038757 [Brassica cretica]|uniref:MATH domain-containing protein n=1 Tax=Brassica cretica TaxID=69181 RepID=A0A8S9SMA3_BRACR|nr:hypothetical protein F2Q69_00038757 [Brassica cretica]